MDNRLLITLRCMLICGLTLLPACLHAQSSLVSVNPGVKLGYEFGQQPGFVFGVEISIVTIPNQNNWGYWGIVVSADRCHDLSKIHLGFEGGYNLVGICIGPTFLSYKGTDDLGFTATPYVGGILIPYGSFTGSSKLGLVSEVGSYIKIPILVKGELEWY